MATSSLDRSVKIHRVSDGRLLLSALLPSGLTSMAMDAGEHYIYAGGSDGVIYEVPLIPSSSHTNSTRGFKGSSAAGAGPSSSLSMQAGMEGAGISSSSFVKMEGHSRAINALSLSVDGETMVSGSEDGTACIWDLRSRQAVHVIQSPGKAPITCALVLPRPEHLSSGGGGGGGRVGPRRPQPLAPLVKQQGMPGSLKPWEGAPVIVDGSMERKVLIATECGLWRGDEGSLAMGSHVTMSGRLADGSASALGDCKKEALEEQVRLLQEELTRSREEAQRWESAHSTLTMAVAESTKVKSKR